MPNLYWFLAAIAGAGLAAQAGVNTQLRAAGSALWTSLISASLTVVLPGAALFLQRDTLVTGGYGRYPWWIWTGGFAGAAYVLAAVAFARSLGAALLVGGMALIRWR